MKKVKNKLLTILILLFLGAADASAQCSMCRRVAETNYNQEQQAIRKGRSLNNGILYLLSIPYLIGAVGVIAWYKNRKKS